jgi:large subunit ribosomal protein L13
MLPKNKLGADLFRNLHVFADSDHKFEAQKPSSIDLNKVN